MLTLWPLQILTKRSVNNIKNCWIIKAKQAIRFAIPIIWLFWQTLIHAPNEIPHLASQNMSLKLNWMQHVPNFILWQSQFLLQKIMWTQQCFAFCFCFLLQHLASPDRFLKHLSVPYMMYWMQHVPNFSFPIWQSQFLLQKCELNSVLLICKRVAILLKRRNIIVSG